MKVTSQGRTELTTRNTLHTIEPEIQKLLQGLLDLTSTEQEGQREECNGQASGDVAPTVQELFREGVKEDGNQEASATEVIFDFYVGDVHYALVRCRDRPQGACNLSPREQEIVRLVACGHPNKTIASILDISPWTVSTHLRRIFVKLGVRSRAEMVASALQADLVQNLESSP